MEYLQYITNKVSEAVEDIGFKPCYKWNTFNT